MRRSSAGRELSRSGGAYRRKRAISQPFERPIRTDTYSLRRTYRPRRPPSTRPFVPSVCSSVGPFPIQNQFRGLNLRGDCGNWDSRYRYCFLSHVSCDTTYPNVSRSAPSCPRRFRCRSLKSKRNFSSKSPSLERLDHLEAVYGTMSRTSIIVAGVASTLGLGLPPTPLALPFLIAATSQTIKSSRVSPSRRSPDQEMS